MVVGAGVVAVPVVVAVSCLGFNSFLFYKWRTDTLQWHKQTNEILQRTKSACMTPVCRFIRGRFQDKTIKHKAEVH
jgi:hypothetical protein